MPSRRPEHRAVTVAGALDYLHERISEIPPLLLRYIIALPLFLEFFIEVRDINVIVDKLAR
jgi:hypothetical protein